MDEIIDKFISEGISNDDTINSNKVCNARGPLGKLKKQ
jgi:hypothetical protein